MKDAIEKAIEGGYKIKGVRANSLPHIHWAIIVYDPLFWQSLGKALGWEEKLQLNPWKRCWHNFIDHLIGGKGAEEFFNQLLK